jgi:glyoxylase-like metal-dependent hydrolase (beta-lactamase superfamily II)
MTTRIHAFVDEGLGHSSFLVDLGDGTAALIDPPRFPLPHEAAARARSLAITWTIDTHSHADYVTGSPGLAARRSATFIAPAASRLEMAHRPVSDGDRVELAAGVTLTAIATPGHTPDHHAYVLADGGVPVALFTGGSLMVGTVGRTDLCGPDLAAPLAHDMFRSLRRFDGLPDGLPVYPTHGAGSFCSAPGGAARTTTLGHERATNPLLRVADEDTFVERLLDGFGSFPSYFARLPELNRRGPRHYDSPPSLAKLDAATVERHVAAGAVVIDVRPIAEFSAGHVPGSISNALRPVFPSWLGWIVEPVRPLVFVAGDDQNRDEIVRGCLDIGHEQLLGELDGGIDAWTTTGRPVARIPLVGPDAAGRHLLDVRQRAEYRSGHVPGAQNAELGGLPHTAVPEEPLTVMCGHGERAMTAASVLAARGRHDVMVLDGGPDTWAAWSGTALEVGP